MTADDSIRALIVDDEAPARRRMRRMLESSSGIEVVGEAADAFEALAAVAREPVDLMLLDIHMPDMEGTRLAERLRDLELVRHPLVVMVTAHAEHAVRAFDLDVVDYLLKPVSSERLGEALERVRRRLGDADEAPVREASPPPRLVARHAGTSYLLDPAAIVHLHAADKYVLVELDGAEYVLDESLNTLEQQLASRGFVRVHRSELVRLDAVVALHSDDGGAALELRTGRRVPVSRRRLADLRRALGL